jgi:hypothetical protein
MKLVYLITSFSALLVMDIFLKVNILEIGGQGDFLFLLITFTALGGLLFLWRVSTSKSTIIRPSFLILLLFLFYFSLRIILDIGSLDALKAYIVATTGGVLLFYILGALVAIVFGRNIKYVLNSIRYHKIFVYLFIIYMIICLTLLLELLFEFAARLRIDILLIEDVDGAYQRAGNFLVISYIISIYLYAHFSALKKVSKEVVGRFVSVIVFVLFLIYTFVSILIAQMIGSNSAAVVVAGLGILVIAMSVVLNFKSSNNYLSVKKIGIMQFFFGKLFLRLSVSIFVALVIMVGVIIFGVNFLGIDLSVTRIGGFGTDELSSVSSRLKLLDNFMVQFSYSPLLGNMSVDCLTTGCGSYVHSLPAMLLTHTGVLGFILFFLFVLVALKERFINQKRQTDKLFLLTNIVNTYFFVMILFVLLISSVATAITWSTLWFSMGLFLSGIEFKNKL